MYPCCSRPNPKQDERQIKKDAKQFPPEKKASKKEKESTRDNLVTFLFSGTFRQQLDKLEEAEKKKEEQRKEFLERVYLPPSKFKFHR